MLSAGKSEDAVAIIGMALRYAGASTVKQYWQNIRNNVDALHSATDEEVLEAGVDPRRVEDPAYVRPAAFIPHTADFDATFFGFSAHDAAIVDPQHRVFLECAWEAFEDAGYNPLASGIGVGVVAGCGANSYRKQNLGPNISMGSMLETMVGNDKDFLATRVAYKLNLTGPAVVVQSACSTSLVATKMAFDSLRSGECSMALAGGVSISFPQNTGYVFEPGMILSPDGRCRAFDAQAGGTAIGRGAGAVLLKPLSAAIRDNDHIYAVIRGAALNNDGASKAGYTAPSLDGQAAVIRKSMSIAGFAPATVRYVEAHGTGTQIGDSIEIAALAQAFGDAPLPAGSCTISSVKPNVGHTDTAAGVSGLIKAALALHHRMVPGTLYFQQPNPELGLHRTPFRVIPEMEPYTGEAAYRAGVSAFGIGGTNAHVSLEEWRPEAGRPSPEVSSADPTTAPQPLPAATNGHHRDTAPVARMFPLSANSPSALARVRQQLADFIEASPEVPLEDIAFTLQAGRKAFTHRSFLVARDRHSLVAALRSADPPKHQQATITDQRRPDVYFLFPGQGAQYVNMTRGLYETDAAFRAMIDHGCEVLRPQLGLDLRSILYPAPGDEEAAGKRLQQTEITQPAVFLVEYAIARRLIDYGIAPTALIGHSLGEYVASVIAGVFQLDTHLRLIAERGRLIQTIPGGSMLAVSLSEQELLLRLPEGICIAAINAPRQTIVSGPTDLIDAFYHQLLKDRIACQLLPTSHAFHSSMLDPLAGSTAANLRKIPASAMKIPFVSNLTGTWITEDEAKSPEYWEKHLRHAVRFADGFSLLIKKGHAVLVEVGPGETLLALARSATKGMKGFRHIPTTRRATVHTPDDEHWMQALGQLWIAGVSVDWQATYGEIRPQRVSLPTYPFERQRYWIDHSPKTQQPDPAQAAGPLRKQPDPKSWLYTRSWQSSTAQPAPAAPRTGQHWLIFKDPVLDRLGAVTQQLTATGTVTLAVPGQYFKKISGNAFVLDKDQPADLASLMQHLQEAGNWPTAILYPVAEGEAPQAGIEKLFALCHSISSLQQPPVDLFVLTDRAFDVFEDGTCRPASTAFASLIDAIGLEVQNVRTHVVDCDYQQPRLLGRQICHELIYRGESPLVAFRGRTRWQPSWSPLLPAATDAIESRPLRPGGTYIVAGGTGGIGLALAQYLARTASAHLVLVSRNAFAPPSEWERLAADSSAAASDRIKAQALSEIRLFGGTVELCSADLADVVRMRQVVAHARQHNGTIAGIIHAAGIVAPTPVGTTSRETIDAIFTSKDAGTRWIEEVLQAPAQAPDFVVLCSSLSAIVPSVGLSVYGASNAILDGFAAAHDNPEHTRVISANWDNWSETGMAHDAAAGQQAHHLRGLKEFGITSQEGEQVFDYLLRAPGSQVAVSTRPLPAWISQLRTIYSAEPDSAAAATGTVAGEHHPRPDLTQEYAPPTNDTEKIVVGIWQELLGLDRVGIHDDFFELGGHSLLGTQVIARVREHFQVDFPLRLIFEATTPESFSSLLLTLPRISKPGHRLEEEGAARQEIEI